MVICFNCDGKTKEALDKLVRLGEYSDHSEAIAYSIQNALVLQREVANNGNLVLEDKTSRVRQLQGKPPTFEDENDAELDDGIQQEESKESETHLDNKVSALFTQTSAEREPPQLAELPFDMWSKGQEVPLDRWLFGQFNKLLPVKATCRALAVLMQAEPEGVPLETATDTISNEAVGLGDYLAQHDKVNGINRDHALSTAFPNSGKGVDKSRRRFATQFVANVNKNGQLSGLPFNLKLLNRTGAKDPRLILTKPGWQFARLLNPVLDNHFENPRQKFSEPERMYLLSHISRSVPVEDSAYRYLLKTISEGRDTPDDIDSLLQESLDERAISHLSDSFLSSQRSGAISRMEDMNLIERVRKGTRIVYRITQDGITYLQEEG